MAVFTWFRPGYELVTAKFEWKVLVPFLQDADGKGKELLSPLFSSEDTPERKWQLSVEDEATDIDIALYNCNSKGEREFIVEAVSVLIWIKKENGDKVFEERMPSKQSTTYVSFMISKQELVESQCQVNGCLTFCLKISSHVKISEAAVTCNDGLFTYLEKLYHKMKFSDINFKVCGRLFPAHKLILTSRSEYFEAMFKHPTVENVTNQIVIEDMEPEVFEQLLQFIYTGRILLERLDSIAIQLFIAADKYLLEGLKHECENYILRNMSPLKCLEILLQEKKLNSERLKKEAVRAYFRSPVELMTTSKWEKIKAENATKLVELQKFAITHYKKYK